jgi:hypothetical protein
MNLLPRAAALTAVLIGAFLTGSPTAALAVPDPEPPPAYAAQNVRAPEHHTSSLTIRTAPASPGVQFLIDGTTIMTDDDGKAFITWGTDFRQHTLTIMDTKLETATERRTFARWVGTPYSDRAFTPTLNGLTVRSSLVVTAAFDVDHSVTPAFVDQHGQPVDPREVSSATARSETGAIVEIAPTGTTWLQGIRVDQRQGWPLELRHLSYTWQTVLIAGSNVVDTGRQSFIPADNPNITAEGHFHDLTISGHDALLRYPAGARAIITFPDGSLRSAVMDNDHPAVFAHLPRGTYQARVEAGSSIVATQQIRLSRDSTLSVAVIGPFDIAILVGGVSAVAAALVLIGRRNARTRIAAPVPPPTAAQAESA